ncbi:MAG: orotate phosphoribosyltransferase [Treponema sp.]|nr:orotate phosphoribosyltransferase [Treponema sp.]
MKDIIPLLKESGAMLEGHFLLSSGRHSDRYFQCARLMQYPDRMAAALEDVVAKIKADMASGKIKIDMVAGPAMGAVIEAYEFGRQLGLPAVFTERDENGAMCLRRFDIKPGTRFLITEDALTTGKSAGECAAALEARGGIIVALACIVDRRLPGHEVKWPFYPAVKVDAVDWAAADCGLCKKGIPVVKPGSRKQ